MEARELFAVQLQLTIEETVQDIHQGFIFSPFDTLIQVHHSDSKIFGIGIDYQSALADFARKSLLERQFEH